MRAFLIAVQFLTRLPVPGGSRPAEAAGVARAAIFFPLVGAGIGLFTAGIVAAVGLTWPLPVAVVVALAAEAILTGALHEDAVADFCDAFGGAADREGIRRILKDSRIGSFGALGLGLAVLLRAAATTTLTPQLLLAAIVAASTLGRWAMVILMSALRPPPDQPSLARDLGGHLSARHLITATLLAVPGSAALATSAPWRLVAALVALLALIGASHFYLRRRLGGATGDCLGAVGYAGQLVVLLAATFHPGGAP